jgi:hypothetical protein
MNYSPKPRRGAQHSGRCPVVYCHAAAGQPCRNQQGGALPGVHFQRNLDRRRMIAAAFELYRPLPRPESVQA